MDIKGKVIVVTGAAQGLGREIAVTLAQKGAKLGLIDMSLEKLDDTISLCREAGAEAVFGVEANVAVENDVVSSFQCIVSSLGPIAGLVNNAGITRDGLFIKVNRETGQVEKAMSMDQWQQVIDVNLTGTFLCGREAAIQMINSNTEGLIINISSISRSGNMGQTNYTASKAGVEAMAVTWAKELARYGIRAASIAPGYIGTEMVMSMKPEALDKIASGIPAKRLGKPAEIANTVQFIFENEYVNGRCMEVDGGLRI